MQVTSLTCPYCQSFSGIWRVSLHPSYLFVSFCLCFVNNLMVMNIHPESWERSAGSTELGCVQQILDFQHKWPNVDYYYIVADDVPGAILDKHLCLNSRRSAGSHWTSLQPSYHKSLFTYIARQGGCSSSHLPVLSLLSQKQVTITRCFLPGNDPLSLVPFLISTTCHFKP